MFKKSCSSFCFSWRLLLPFLLCFYGSSYLPLENPSKNKTAPLLLEPRLTRCCVLSIHVSIAVRGCHSDNDGIRGDLQCPFHGDQISACYKFFLHPHCGAKILANMSQILFELQKKLLLWGFFLQYLQHRMFLDTFKLLCKR